jgi:hypothetical protein
MNKKMSEAYSPEQVAKVLAEFKDSFDPVEAEREYRDMIENGGVRWEDLMLELDGIDRRLQKEKQ